MADTVQSNNYLQEYILIIIVTVKCFFYFIMLILLGAYACISYKTKPMIVETE